MDKAVFINLDNTLITTITGRAIPLHSEDWKIEKKMMEVLKVLNNRGYQIAIISNQPQIEQGLVAEVNFKYKLELIAKTIEKEIKVKTNVATDYCTKENTYRYIPNPGMIYDTAIEYFLDLRNSIMIGNLPIHEQLAINSGIGTYYDYYNLYPEKI